jgi:hypothetical protein
MKFTIKALAAAAIALAAAPAFAGTQVIAGPGVSLTEAAQAKFNRDTRGDDRHYSVTPGKSSPESRAQLIASAGLSADEAAGLSLNEIFVAKINSESRGDEQQRAAGGTVTMSSRSVGAADAQLIAAAGLSASEAAGMTLSEIAAAKFARDTGSDNR